MQPNVPSLPESITNTQASGAAPVAGLTLSLSEDTRVFLQEAFASLAETLRSRRDRSAEEEAAYLRAHLGVPEAQQTRVARRFPAWAANHVLVALEAVLRTAPYRVHEVVAFGYHGRGAPTFRTVAVTPDESREVPEDGWYAAFRDTMPFAVEVQAPEYDEPMLVVTILLAAEHRDIGLTLLRAVEAYPNFYRGQVITIDEDGNPSFLWVPAVAVEDVVLEPETWEELRRQVLDFVPLEPAFRAARLPSRRGVILAGPPGVGKTLVFRALSSCLAGRCTVLWLTARAIGYPAAVPRLFALARSLAPALMLWEDLDLVVRDREAGNASILGELLAQLDGAGSSDGVITCASTNDPSVLDEALSSRASRFDRIIWLGPPSQPARLDMLRRFTAGVPQMRADLRWVAGETAGLTGAELRELVVTAFAEAQREARASGQAHDGASAPAPLEAMHFVRALRQLAAAQSAAQRSGVRKREIGRAHV